MEEKYITIKEATSLSGKSEYEIRKWTQAQQARQEAQQATQEALEEAQQPSEEAQEPIEPIEIKVRREHQSSNPNSPLKYMIREDVVLEVFGKKEEDSTSSISENNPNSQAQQATQQASEATQQAQQVSEDSLVDFLKGQIKEKDETIRNLQEDTFNKTQTINFLLRLQAPRPQPQQEGENNVKEAETN